MQLLTILTYFISFLLLEILYFKLADYFNIIDKPNHRSSHSNITLRGGGVVFCLAVLAYSFSNGFEYPYFVVGLLAISLISFLDDIIDLNNKIRLSVHLMATFLLFYQWNLFSLDWYILIFAFIFVIATINAYNFMDGINGMTGGYSLLTIATLFYINQYVINFIASELLVVVGISLLVFNIFNFKKKAKCFAGDVGAVGMAFIIVFLIGSLILKSGNLSYILLLLCYGIETAFTVFFRKIRKENIFKAHRSHFYQYLTNQLKYSHVIVSIIFIAAQLLINTVLIMVIGENVGYSALLFFTVCAGYLLIRFNLEGSKRLLSKYDFD